MALNPDNRFDPQDLMNQFTIGNTAVAGSLLTRDTTDTSVVGQGDCPYGRVVAGSISVASDRELGVLFYDVTVTGVPFFDQVAGVLSYQSAQGQPCALWKTQTGDIFSTTSFATGAQTGAIVAGASSGNTAADTLLGIINGQYVVKQSSGAGSVARAKLIGNTQCNGVTAIRVQVL